MAELEELSTRLLQRFKNVPNVTLADTEEWISLAMNEHGFATTANVPTAYITLIMLYAEADGTGNIALSTAYYFEYKDGEETVDKKGVSEQYRKIATELWKKYERKKADSGISGATRFVIAKRADR